MSSIDFHDVISIQLFNSILTSLLRCAQESFKDTSSTFPSASKLFHRPKIHKNVTNAVPLKILKKIGGEEKSFFCLRILARRDNMAHAKKKFTENHKMKSDSRSLIVPKAHAWVLILYCTEILDS